MSSSKRKSLPTLAERLALLEAEQEERSSALEEHGSGFRHNHKKSKAKRRLELISKTGGDDASEGDDSDGGGDRSGNEEGKKKKKHKNAPAELPSNKPVRRLRVTADNTKKEDKFMDPRFAEYTGKLDLDKFHNSYAFLDQYQESEINNLSKVSKKLKSENKKQVVKSELLKMKQEMTERRRALRAKEVIKEAEREERQKVKEGKKPFFLKNSAKKAIVLEERFKELKKDHKLKKFIEKKRRKNASKDRRWMPRDRPQDE